MSLWSILTGWITEKQTPYVYEHIPADRAPDASDDPAPLAAGRDYVRIWLSEMYLSRTRNWFTEWHPAVHTLVRLQHGTTTVEVPQVVGELKLDGVDQAHLNNVVRLDAPLTTLLPFHGGTIEVIAGLLALQGDRGISSFVNTLSNFAGLLAVPQLSAALAVAQPLANGIEQLIVTTNGGLHLGLHQSFADAGGGGAHGLEPGYIAIVRTDGTKFASDRLWVDRGRLTYASDGGARAQFSGADYILLHIEKRPDRDDWEGFPSIIDPFNNALTALGDDQRERADSLLRVAVATVLQSPDLTAVDRRRVATALRDRYHEALDLGLAAARPEESASLAELVERAMPVNEAVALGEPSLEELFAQ